MCVNARTGALARVLPKVAIRRPLISFPLSCQTWAPQFWLVQLARLPVRPAVTGSSHAYPAFTWALGTRPQVLRLVKQGLYPISHTSLVRFL